MSLLTSFAESMNKFLSSSSSSAIKIVIFSFMLLCLSGQWIGLKEAGHKMSPRHFLWLQHEFLPDAVLQFFGTTPGRCLFRNIPADYSGAQKLRRFVRKISVQIRYHC